MTEYRVTWCQCPHVRHVPQLLFIEAGSAADAEKIARDHIERTFGIEWFSIFTVTEPKAVPAGHVISKP